MWNIKEVLKIGISSFCSTIFVQHSLRNIDFSESIYWISEKHDTNFDIDKYIAYSMYDNEIINNLCKDIENQYFNRLELLEICVGCFIETIRVNRSIKLTNFVETMKIRLGLYEKGLTDDNYY